MKPSSPSFSDPLPDLRDVRDYMLASIQLQHPEWTRSSGEDSPLSDYDRKLTELFAGLQPAESPSSGLAA